MPNAPLVMEYIDVNVPVMFGPNITGRAAMSSRAGLLNPAIGVDLSGAFYADQTISRKYAIAEGGGSKGYDLGISASRSNLTFGNATGVQPSSSRLMHCVKI